MSLSQSDEIFNNQITMIGYGKSHWGRGGQLNNQGVLNNRASFSNEERSNKFDAIFMTCILNVLKFFITETRIWIIFRQTEKSRKRKREKIKIKIYNSYMFTLLFICPSFSFSILFPFLVIVALGFTQRHTPAVVCYTVHTLHKQHICCHSISHAFPIRIRWNEL